MVQVGLDAVDVEVVEAKGRRVRSERDDGEQQPQPVQHVSFLCVCVCVCLFGEEVEDGKNGE